MCLISTALWGRLFGNRAFWPGGDNTTGGLRGEPGGKSVQELATQEALFLVSLSGVEVCGLWPAPPAPAAKNGFALGAVGFVVIRALPKQGVEAREEMVVLVSSEQREEQREELELQEPPATVEGVMHPRKAVDPQSFSSSTKFLPRWPRPKQGKGTSGAGDPATAVHRHCGAKEEGGSSSSGAGGPVVAAV